ncbi:CBS domain-containing protein [Deinococcus apachensis]|uniref:CBS domain-containing protein n=1 Tax=Deinococcus apachensis TaxID=309886 RepID=UPI00036A479C|nr:CBS domain-containing protein [Deinococcus apachensis]
MNVAALMTSPPVSVTPDYSLPDAARLMRQRGIRRLPVLDGPRLVGIVTDRDLREAMPGRVTTLSMWEATTQLAGVCVGDVMRRSVVTTTPDADARDAAYTLLRWRIGGMPVVDDSGAVVGMLTITDLLHDYARMPEPLPKEPGLTGTPAGLEAPL